jgi:hypothetical protein
MAIMEEMLAQKFERLQEVKMTYDFMIKKLNKEEYEEKIN